MPRITKVRKARQNQGFCSSCGTELKKGMPYRWIKFRYQAKRKRCMADDCRFRQSDMTTSDKLSRFYAANENIEDVIANSRKFLEDSTGEEFAGYLNDIKEALEEAQGEYEEVATEYTEGAENILDHFSESEVADEMISKADQMEEFRGQMDNIIDNLNDVISVCEEGEQSHHDMESALDEIESEIAGFDLY